MPYIMIMGSLSAQHLSKDEGATVYGLKSDERATLVRVIIFVIFINKYYNKFCMDILRLHYILHTYNKRNDCT